MSHECIDSGPGIKVAGVVGCISTPTFLAIAWPFSGDQWSAADRLAMDVKLSEPPPSSCSIASDLQLSLFVHTCM